MVKYYVNIKRERTREKATSTAHCVLSMKCNFDDSAGLIMNMRSPPQNRSTIRKQSGNSTPWMSDKSDRRRRARLVSTVAVFATSTALIPGGPISIAVSSYYS